MLQVCSDYRNTFLLEERKTNFLHAFSVLITESHNTGSYSSRLRCILILRLACVPGNMVQILQRKKTLPWIYYSRVAKKIKVHYTC